MLQNQIAFVTGASRGIGHAIALELGSRGATVIGTATTDDGAQIISNYLKEAGVNGRGATLNVNNASNAVRLIGEGFGPEYPDG